MADADEPAPWMQITERSRRAADAAIRNLTREHGQFDVVEKTWDRSPRQYESIVDRFEQGRLGSAGVWLTDDSGAVLLVRNAGDDEWADPAGKVEPGEGFEAAARRELGEETSVDCTVTGVCDVHLVEHRAPRGEDPAVYEPLVTFRAEYVAGDPTPREGEIAELGWFTAPPANVQYEEIRTRPYPGGE